MMDVKRPRVRVFGDENAAPKVLQQKTLHTRHKSQPVLKAALSTIGPQKLGNRRAFDDVSNIATSNFVKNDYNAAKGKPFVLRDKIIIGEQEQKSTPSEQEPVCPPPSVRPLRSAASSIVLKPMAAAPQQTATRPTVQPTLYQKPAAKTLRKSKTTIFQDKSKAADVGPTKIQQDLAVFQPAREQQQQSLFSLSEEVTVAEEDESLDSQVLASQALVSQALPISDLILEPLDPLLSTSTTEEEMQQRLADQIFDHGSASDLSTIESFLPAGPEDLDSYDSAQESIPDLVSSSGVMVPEPFHAEAVPEAEHLREVLVEPQPPNSATIPEPEEYWDVEEDDGYVDEGYVTARSFRSIGESQVTASVTRTLYPHVDQSVEHEIAAAKVLIESSLDPREVADEAWDTSMVQEYGDEIFEYMRELEVRMSPNPHYMDKQTEIQWSMRSVLMDWIVQVHARFGLLPETLFLCTNLIDRFLSQKIVSLTKLQLVGATAIFVAAKYEEVDCPTVQEVNFMVDDGYCVEEILKAERFMLSMLGFELGFPGPMSFLRRISKADDYDLETRTLAKYFLEITIMDERFLPCVPSFSAAGAHCLARLMLHKGNWSPAHVYYSNYTYSQLYPLISLMAECCEDPVLHHSAIYEKYLDRRYKQAAKYVQTEMENGFRVPEDNTGSWYHTKAYLQPSYPPRFV